VQRLMLLLVWFGIQSVAVESGVKNFC